MNSSVWELETFTETGISSLSEPDLQGFGLPFPLKKNILKNRF
jgi:hypothetical protein